MIRKFLLCNPMPSDKIISWASLILRVLVSASMLTHGVAKIAGFSDMSESFPDPLHIGNSTSLVLAIFAEVVCSILLIVGFFTRMSAAILLFTMLVIVVIVDAGDPYASREMASLYTISYAAIFLLGGAQYSVDHCIGNSCRHKQKTA